MNCVVCCRDGKTPAGDQDCFEVALDTMKAHYRYFKTTSNENAITLKVLQERNAQLMRAVEMLQQQAAKPSAKSCAQTKENRIGIFNNSVDLIEIPATESIHDDNICDEDSLALKSTTRFNKTVKMNQQRIDGLKHRLDKHLDKDELSATAKRRKLITSSVLSDIFGTEYDDCSFIDDDGSASKLNMALNSEQLLNTSIQVLNDDSIADTKNLREPRKIDHSHKATENRSALANVAEEDDVRGSKNSKWMSKTNCSHQALQPVRSNVSSVGFQNKNCLSLSRKGGNIKKKQTRLQLNLSRGKTFSESISDFCEDVVNASPNRDGSLTKSNEQRCMAWLQRTGSSIDNASSKKLQAQSVKKTTHNAEDDGQQDIFKSSAHEDLLDEFELRPEEDLELPHKGKPVAAIENAIAMKPPKMFDASFNDTSSVVMITPVTQDVIFLDDSNSSMLTMDLLNDLAGSDDYMHLKRFESAKINELMQDATKPGASGTATTAKPIERQEKPDLKSILDKIKWEQDCNNTTQLETTQGAVIKQEQEGAKTGLGVEDGAQKRHFNVDCEDCQKYIDFMGHDMSDEAVYHLMRKCRHQKEIYALNNATPEGFWNPLLQSFDANDPRNEVLIDTRFVGKKRTGRYGDPKV